MSYHRTARGLGALGSTPTCPSGYTFDGSACQPDSWDCTTSGGQRGRRNAQGVCETILLPSPYYPPGKTPGASSTNTPPPGTPCPTGFYPWAPSPTGCAPSNVMQPCWDLSTQKPGVINVLGMCEPTGYLPGVHPTTMAPKTTAPSTQPPGPTPAPPKMSCPTGYVYRPDINTDRCIHEKFGQPCSTPAGPGTVDAFGTCMFKNAGEPCSGPAGEPGVWRSDGICLYTPKGGGVTPVPPQPVPPMPPVPVAQAGLSMGTIALGALLFCGVVVVGVASSK